METVAFDVNGRSVQLNVEPRTLLVDVLRDQLRLTGTHVGCDTSQCGACVVLLGGRSVKSCSLLAVQADGGAITTIEGLAQNGVLHPMQAAFQAHHALQCGYCTPGLVLSAIDLARVCPDADEAIIRRWISGHLCRCTGYQSIVAAIEAGLRAMQRAEPAL